MLDDSVFTTARDIFSVIGVCATVGGLGWRVFTWRHARGTHLRVEVANVLPVYGDKLSWCFSVAAVNRGDHAAQITSAGFVLPDGRDLVVVAPPFPGALPTEVPPRDSRQTWIEVDALKREGVDVYAPIVGFVHTSTGERFRSRPKILLSRD